MLALAMDKKTVRKVDSFGKLHVELSNISKSAVNPYYGNEIPNAEALGLDLMKVYYLLRCPEELAKGADTFNNLPLLSKHVPVTVEKPPTEFIVGSTGTDAVFDEPFLRNSLVVWDALAIAGIDTNQQRQLSSAYSYEADMTPGNYGGLKYDGVMRNIKGNHVALVEVGRAGPEVLVGDSKLTEKSKMKKPLSAKALMVLCALQGYASTVLAQDAQINIGDMRTVVDGVTALKTEKERKAVVAAFTKATTGKLAEDSDLSQLAPLVASIGEAEEPEMPNAMGNDNDYGSQLAALLGQMGMGPDVIAQIQAMCSGGAMDADPEPEKKDETKVDKQAMDAAIAAAVNANKAANLAIRNAEIEVAPIIGQLVIAQDSAEAVYKLALDHAGVDLTDVPPTAYKALVGMALKQRSAPAQPPRVIAQDSATNGATAFAEMFGKASKPNLGA